ncbi:hypothetical protein [Heyndrickxia ginsengihumi]|uniref:hypothetical protein n=1 Tax=Heyndrickxia ginsengihumi TaxID=363870 RepID=UPI0004700B2A|nr:hypothetical protein [Heyndrickxia ginsengihumi]
MNAQRVYQLMKEYHSKTGKVMQGPEFEKQILSNFDSDSVIDGLLLFNKFLDESRSAFFKTAIFENYCEISL